MLQHKTTACLCLLWPSGPVRRGPPLLVRSLCPRSNWHLAALKRFSSTWLVLRCPAYNYHMQESDNTDCMFWQAIAVLEFMSMQTPSKWFCTSGRLMSMFDSLLSSVCRSICARTRRPMQCLQPGFHPTRAPRSSICPRPPAAGPGGTPTTPTPLFHSPASPAPWRVACLAGSTCQA